MGLRTSCHGPWTSFCYTPILLLAWGPLFCSGASGSTKTRPHPGSPEC